MYVCMCLCFSDGDRLHAFGTRQPSLGSIPNLGSRLEIPITKVCSVDLYGVHVCERGVCFAQYGNVLVYCLDVQIMRIVFH